MKIVLVKKASMSLFRLTIRQCRYKPGLGQFTRRQFASITPKDAARLESEKKEAAALAMQSIKDVGRIFSSDEHDDPATQPIDTLPIYQDPRIFSTLSLLHQGQVEKELQAKYDKTWTKLTIADKKLGYFIAYGDWGVREDFHEWKSMAAPLDLPFHLPSKIKTFTPSSNTIVKKLDPVILAETPVRLKQFDTQKLDTVTKVFLYMIGFITVAALCRDKLIGEEGKPKEMFIEDRYEIARQKRILEEEAAKVENEKLELEKKSRKWYFLWIR